MKTDATHPNGLLRTVEVLVASCRPVGLCLIIGRAKYPEISIALVEPQFGL